MTTLERYRRCFEACGIELPAGFEWATASNPERFAINDTDQEYGGFMSDAAELCVCRCAAEDWLASAKYMVSYHVGIAISEDGFTFRATSEHGPSYNCTGRSEHAALINLCCAVANKQETDHA